MKESDIHNGDLFLDDDLQLFKVRCRGNVFCENESGNIRYTDSLVPIEVSEAFFAKNGFETSVLCKDLTHCERITDEPFSVEVILGIESIATITSEVGEATIRFKYIHELQHLLRVMGLCEIADSFVL